MPRLLFLCTTIVAAFQLHLSAAAALPTTAVPVSPSVAALAGRVGMDPARERSRFTAEIIRRVYSPPLSRQIATNVVVGARELPGPGAPVLVDVPLSPEVWSQAVFKRAVPADQLLATVLADRRAALLCRGLLGSDDATLEYYANHPALLTFLYEHAPGSFSAFASSVRIHDGRLLVPGGDAAQRLWQGVLKAGADDPEAFLRALLIEPETRAAYLFDVLATASPGSRAFALGLWLDDESLRARRFQALTLAVRGSFREWHVEELPFARPLNDLALLLLRIRVDERGEPAQPNERRFWSQVFDAPVTLEPSALPPGPTHGRIDAAWLLGATDADLYARGDRLDQLAFGQRVFGPRPDGSSDATAAILRELPSRRMLLFSLERLGLSEPEVYSAGLREARALADGGAERFWALSQFQGALAILVRMSATESVRPQDVGALVRSLFDVSMPGGDVHGAVAEWMRGQLGPHLPSGDTWQARVTAAVAGGPTPGLPEVDWEGQRYRVDLAFAERRRIEGVQRKQGGPDFDLALAIAALGQRVAHASSIDVARPLAAEGRQVLAESGTLLVRTPASAMARGLPEQRDSREWYVRSLDDLDRAIRSGDPRRVSRAGESLIALGDVTLGHALLSFSYAMHLGDPEGPALLGANVALRHDYAFWRRDGEGRSRGAWAVPRQDFQPGVPWHVVGALLGLDVGLAPLSLHRISMDGLAAPPRLQSIEREAFAMNVTMLNPRRLHDLDRDRIVAAIAQGRTRVRGLSRRPADFEKLENDLVLDGWRARSLRWLLQNEPASMENQLSLAEFVTLGNPELALDDWGANGLLSFGCLCTRFPGPRVTRVLAGRAQLATLAASTVEMNLEMAQRFAALRLPAALLPSVLATAMQDFIDQVDPADPADAPALARWVKAVTENAVDDHVSATATLDGPLVSRDAGDVADR